MSQKLKVTFIEIYVDKDGEPIGKGEIYWNMSVDGAIVSNRTSTNPRKTGSGETITLNDSVTVTKNPGQYLTIAGSVSERDNLDKDESCPFEDVWSGPSWGTGQIQKKNLSDRELAVTIQYKVEKV